MRSGLAHAKINLALVVGPARNDGKHELVTVYQRISLADRIGVEPAAELRIDGFDGDTLVRSALEALSERAGLRPPLSVSIEKKVPVAAGLGGGSSDAAAALRLANEELPSPLPEEDLYEIARRLGADVSFFLAQGPQLGTGDGSRLSPLARLPQDYFVLLVLPAGIEKTSTADVYRVFDVKEGWKGFEDRRSALHEALARVEVPSDLALLPPNDLASSPLSQMLLELGAFRAGVSGAGPAVLGLFERCRDAESAADAAGTSDGIAAVWLSEPTW